MATEPATPKFHVAIVLGQHSERIEACLAALLAQTLPPWQVTVFDNTALSEAGERVARAYAQSPVVRLMRSPLPLGPVAGLNRAAAMARGGEFLLLLDADAVLAVHALERLAEVFARQPGMGVLGCKVLDRDVETIRQVGLELSANALPHEVGRGEPDREQYRGLRETAGVPTAALAVRQEVWSELGGLDEAFPPAIYEGLDFCYRARAVGWRVAVACEATVTHFNLWTPRRGDRAGLENFLRGRARFLAKHYSLRDWLTLYLPAEARWVRDRGNQGMRWIALRSILRQMLSRRDWSA